MCDIPTLLKHLIPDVGYCHKYSNTHTVLISVEISK